MAEDTLQFRAASNWTRLDFSLRSPSPGHCDALSNKIAAQNGVACPPADTQGAGHICVRCGAAFQVSASGPVHLGFASVMPGPWGRHGGLSVNRGAAVALATMGTSLGGQLGSDALGSIGFISAGTS